jgi:competence protein ComEA
MPAEPRESERPAWPRLVLRRADQAAAALVLAASLATIGLWWLWQGRIRGRLIDIDQAAPVAVDFKIDVNQADWPELALVPDIGEQLARRIVENRRQNGPFRDLDDLRRVRGIGPRTLETMRPFLLPLPDWEATAEGKAGRAPPAKVN